MPDLTLAGKPKIGRPRKFQSPTELEAGIDAYFAAQDVKDRPYTMEGLARALDCDRNTLLRYSDEEYADEPYCRAIKRARQRVAEWTEERLYSKGCHPAGPIFSLKNNFGWKDEQQITHTHEAVFTLRSQADVRLYEPPVIELSPRTESVAALSPAPAIAVSAERVEAKAPPSEGVSPPRVA